ncbi:hypothetical protein ACFSR7_06130 [Cohnella sp. GCM10020058]|uniref:hypothetical protein n=1 Tax=Cohnella sp. GCM10020058 TaxID=3317330 RepID=UPI00363C81D4
MRKDFFRKVTFILFALTLFLPGSAWAARATAPYSTNIQVVNNPAGTPDTVTVSDLLPSDIIKVYADSSTMATLGTTTVAAGSTRGTVTIAQIGTASGTLYITVTSGALSESNRTAKSFAAEPRAARLDTAQITVVNNPVGTADVVKVENVSPSDVIKVYNDPVDTPVIGTGTVASGQNEILVSIAQLGTTSGTVYVSITTGGLPESQRTAKNYAAEIASLQIVATDVIISNNLSGLSDTIVVMNVQSGDVIKVYGSSLSTTLLAQGTATGKTITLSVAQLGSNAGVVYLTRTRAPSVESVRTVKNYSAESSSSLGVYGIKVINNAGKADLITIPNVLPSDVIKVYASSSATTPLVTSTASKNLVPNFNFWTFKAQSYDITGNYSYTLAANSTSSSINSSYYDVPVLPGQTYAASIGTVGTGGLVNLIEYKNGVSNGVTKTLVSGGTTTWALKSDTTHVRFELTSTTIAVINFNNPMLVLGSTAGAFEEQSGSIRKNLLPPLSAWNSLSSISSILSDYKLQLNPTASNATNYVMVRVQPNTKYSFTVKHNGLVSFTVMDNTKSTVATPYLASTEQEGTFTTPATAYWVQVAFSNGTSLEQITFSNFMLNLGGVSSFEAQRLDSVNATVSYAQLGTAAGKVYVTTTTPGKQESKRMVASYSAEPRSAAPALAGIKIVNKKGTGDTITITGLAVGDVVKVYRTKATPTVLASYTVTSGTVGYVNAGQLGTSAGTVYITVTNSGKVESLRVAKSYTKE